MNQVLTEAGIKLCISLGLAHQTFDACEIALMQRIPPSDMFMRGAAAIVSSPDNKPPSGWSECIAFGRYQMYDGNFGTSYFCTRNRHLIWIPGTAIWQWEADKSEQPR